MKYRSRDGRWTVETVVTESGEWLYIREHGYYAGRVRKPEHLAALYGIDLATLEEMPCSERPGQAVGAEPGETPHPRPDIA